MRPLSRTLGWRAQASPALAGVTADAEPRKVLLRRERSALRGDAVANSGRPTAAGRTRDCADLGRAPRRRGARSNSWRTNSTSSRRGMAEWATSAARALGFGVDIVTVSGASHMSEPRILSIAGISSKNSLPFFDVAAARARPRSRSARQAGECAETLPESDRCRHPGAHALRSLAEGRASARHRRRRRADRRGARQPVCRPAVRRRRRRQCPRAGIFCAHRRNGRG